MDTYRHLVTETYTYCAYRSANSLVILIPALIPVEDLTHCASPSLGPVIIIYLYSMFYIAVTSGNHHFHSVPDHAFLMSLSIYSCFLTADSLLVIRLKRVRTQVMLRIILGLDSRHSVVTVSFI